MSSSSDLLVIGLGNRLRGDDAVGLVLAERLMKNAPPRVAIELREETDALTLAHDLIEHDAPLLAVDCANMGLAPGEWRLFRSDEAQLRGHADGISTHGIGLADAMILAGTLGRRSVSWIFGVQPASLDPVERLSAEIEERLPEMTAALYNASVRLSEGNAAQ